MFSMAELLHIKQTSLLHKEEQKLAGDSDPSPGAGQVQPPAASTEPPRLGAQG